MKQKIIVLFFIVGVFLFPYCISAKSAEHIKKEVTLVDCVDGDTAWFLIDEVKTKVRFLAIDTRETVHPTKGVEEWGKDASEFTCNKMKQANKIVLEYDPGSSKTDKYGRDLAWVYVDSEFLQESLVRAGYAEVKYIYGTYLYTEQLEQVQKEAQAKKIGIWSTSVESVTSQESVTAPEVGIDFWMIGVAILGIGVFLFLPKKYQTKVKKGMRQIKKAQKK